MKIRYSEEEYKIAKSKEYLSLNCYQCNEDFKAFKSNIKFEIENNRGRLKYCSKTCLVNSQKNKKEYSCTTCTAKFERTTSEISGSKNLFCSTSCAAIFNNKNRVVVRTTFTIKDIFEVTNKWLINKSNYDITNVIDDIIKLKNENYRRKIYVRSCNGCSQRYIGLKRDRYCSDGCYDSHLKASSILPIKFRKPKQLLIKECDLCKTPYESYKEKQKFCSRICSSKNAISKITKEQLSLNGRKAVQANNKRSKNEILFADLCIEKFKNVITNEPMFNGWDADVVLLDLKIAILWNGNWHHKKITKSHSVKQVQNRDLIKIKEIINMGYTPYIINDYGKANKLFVIEKFNEFLRENNLVYYITPIS